MPVLVAQELDALDAEHPRRRTLLFGPDGDQLGVLLIRVLAALAAIGDDDVGDVRPAVRQPSDSAARAEVRVIRVRRDDHHALKLGKFSVASGRRHGKNDKS